MSAEPTSNSVVRRRRWRDVVPLALFVLVTLGRAWGASDGSRLGRISAVSGAVQFTPEYPVGWIDAKTNQSLAIGSAVETFLNSKAEVSLRMNRIARMHPVTLLQLLEDTRSEFAFRIERETGKVLCYFNGEPLHFTSKDGSVTGTPSGTLFEVSMNGDAMTVSVLEGAVTLSSQTQRVSVEPNFRCVVQNGVIGEPEPIVANDVLQWWLYYPVVVHLDDLGLDAGALAANPVEQVQIEDSFAAYRSGNLTLAATSYPTNRVPTTSQEKIYVAVLRLGGGRVTEATNLVAEAGVRTIPEAKALSRMVSAVQRIKMVSTNSTSRSELLANSYVAQFEYDSTEALQWAVQATVGETPFPQAWVRRAELEFAHGRIREARASLRAAESAGFTNSVAAAALGGFVEAGANRIDAAITRFNRAIELDSSYPDAWLGRGLCRIRKGERDEGRQDLLIAAGAAANRSILRSYWGRALHQSGDLNEAAKQLQAAVDLDADDPLPWYYRALLNRDRNRLNAAVRDMSTSLSKVRNRQLINSESVLRGMSADRYANRAVMFRDVGMDLQAVREASHAVALDFANPAAHLFLAGSYAGQLQDRQGDLRFETPALNELLLANLLAPPGAPAISSTYALNEYSPLFRSDGLHGFSSIDYRSNGQLVYNGSVSGTRGRTSFAVDYLRQHLVLEQPNGKLERDLVVGTLRQQISINDSLFVQATYGETQAGDTSRYYDPADANPTIRLKETQEPTVLLGWNHEWQPGKNTLLLLGRVADELNLSNQQFSHLLVRRSPGGPITGVGDTPSVSALEYDARLSLYTAEMAHVASYGQFQSVLGGRLQLGQFDVSSQLGAAPAVGINTLPLLGQIYSTPATSRTARPNQQRTSAYWYQHWDVRENLRLTAGIALDRVTAPANHSIAPVLSDDIELSQTSPKLGFVWEPTKSTRLRVGYSRALGGASFDQSFRIEPTEVAGFNQAYRSLIPESVAGPIAVPEFELLGGAWEQRLGTDTFLTLGLAQLDSNADRRIGTHDLTTLAHTYVTASTPEHLEYRERNLTLSVSRLIDDNWFIGARYSLSDVELNRRLTEIPTAVFAQANTQQESILHHVGLQFGINHSSGFFARADCGWYQQSNRGVGSTMLLGDEFYQANLHAGWRFLGRRARVQVSLLNLTDQDYRVNSLNSYQGTTRERAFASSLSLSF